MADSNRKGMGAIAHAAGVTFRVWAPNAASVAVAGTFNAWSATANPMTDEGAGRWSTDVGSARIGHEYKFVIVNRDSRAALWKNDPYALEMTHSAGNAVVSKLDYEWTDAGFVPPAANEMVIYEVHVGSFRFDPASPAKRGTFQSLTEKLDYLADLGVNAIQLMASSEFPTDVSWGYNPTCLFAIESSYGGPASFKSFVNAAHGKGIAVLFDVVYNHLGPTDLDLWQFDGWGGVMGGIYFYNDWRADTPWGKTRPDYSRDEVRDFLRDNALHWLEQRHVDGLRWDATGYIRNVYGRDLDPGSDLPEGWSLMQTLNAEIARLRPAKIVIAEDMQDNELLTRDARAQGAGFDAQWGAGFHHTIRAAIVSPDDDRRDMVAVRQVLEQRFNGDAFQRVLYTESHDEVANGHQRIPEEIWPGNSESYYSQKRSTVGAALVFSAPGIPMIFQGQEFLEDGHFQEAVELDWSKHERHPGIVRLYKDLIRLRRNVDGGTRGLLGNGCRVHHVNDGDKVIAFHRWDAGGAGDDVVVVANLAERSHSRYRIGFPRGGVWKLRFNGDESSYSPAFDDLQSSDVLASEGEQDGLPFGGEITIGAYTAILFSQDE